MTSPARRALVHRLALAGITGADAGRLLRDALTALPLSPRESGSTPPSVLAAGKVAGPMLDAFLEWCDGRVKGGVVAAPTPVHGAPRVVRTFAAGHPVPTRESVDAGQAALRYVGALSAHEHTFVLLSGGASALLAAPVEGVTLDDKVAVTRALLAGGAPIDALNIVRKHLSRVKGGRLAVTTTGRLHTLALSDVIRPVPDDPATIGSGPTVADPSTFADAISVLRTYANPGELPTAVLAHLEWGRAGAADETPKPDDPRLIKSEYHVIGNGRLAASAVAGAASGLGLAVCVRPVPFEGEARHAAEVLLEDAVCVAREARAPLCYVATGETTVTVTGHGRGGRNQELALAAALLLAERHIRGTLVSVGSDGIDGPTDVAGAFADETTISRATARGLSAARRALDDNDSHSFFAALGDTIRTGPTRTNVGDLVIILLA